MAAAQLWLDKKLKPVSTHGGDTRRGKRKIARPLAVKHPMHVVFKARDCLLRRPKNLGGIKNLLTEVSKENKVQVTEMAVVSNHIHLTIRAFNRDMLKKFLRIVSGQIASHVTGAKKGRGLLESFWAQPIWTRILTWGRDYEATREYVKKNELEAEGVIIYYRAPKPKKKSATNPKMKSSIR